MALVQCTGSHDHHIAMVQAGVIVNINGSGKVEIYGTVGSGACINKQGSGDLHVYGYIECACLFNCMGSGDVVIHGLVAETVAFNMNGSGDLRFSYHPPRSVLESLHSTMTGSGGIVIAGSPYRSSVPTGSSSSSSSTFYGSGFSNISTGDGEVRVTYKGRRYAFPGNGAITRNGVLFVDGVRKLGEEDNSNNFTMVGGSVNLGNFNFTTNPDEAAQRPSPSTTQTVRQAAGAFQRAQRRQQAADAFQRAQRRQQDALRRSGLTISNSMHRIAASAASSRSHWSRFVASEVEEISDDDEDSAFEDVARAVMTRTPAASSVSTSTNWSHLVSASSSSSSSSSSPSAPTTCSASSSRSTNPSNAAAPNLDAFVSKCSNTVKQYVQSLQNNSNLRERIESFIEAYPEHEDAFKSYTDPITLDYVCIPVTLHETLFCLESLAKIPLNNPLTREPYNPLEISSARSVVTEVVELIQKLTPSQTSSSDKKTV